MMESSPAWGRSVGRTWREDYQGAWGNFVVMEVFNISIVVLISWVKY